MNTRRQFILALSLVSAALALPAAESRPLLRIGAVSDCHLCKERTNSYSRAKACFELFRRLGVDIVVDTGDIANKSDIDDLKLYRRMFDEAFAGTKCVPFFCVANHDYNYLPDRKRNDPAVIQAAVEALGMRLNPTAEVNGYQFVNVFQHESGEGVLGRAIAGAVKRSVGGRPVFVVNHVPPALTTTRTDHWSSDEVRKAMSPYPQVVALTGHNHAAINWAANIWQGEFTAINLGAHADYSNQIEGEAAVLDVYADRIDIRRYEAVSGREIAAEDRWSIPLPFDPKNGPYRPEVRRREVKVPEFAASATLNYSQAADGASGRLAFSAALSRAYIYRIAFESQAADGKWTGIGTLNWTAPQVMDAPKVWECPIVPAMLDASRPHRATITPENSLGVAGAAKTFQFAAPENPMRPVTEELVRVARYQRSATSGSGIFSPNADGTFKKEGRVVAVVFSKELTAELRRHHGAALVVDIASDQPGQSNTLSLGTFSGDGKNVKYGLGERIYTTAGKIASCRYAWSLKTSKFAPKDEIVLVIREGGRASFKINSVRCLVGDR